jgi:hypothetical protein
MSPIMGLLSKKGASPKLTKPVQNLPFLLHNYSRGNAGVRKHAGTIRSSGIRYNRSRSMGGY